MTRVKRPPIGANMEPHCVHQHVFIFNPADNGGEQLQLSTEFVAYPSSEEVLTNHHITLNSYSNSASISLYGVSITPEMLRKLADSLEEAAKVANSLHRLVTFYVNGKKFRFSRNSITYREVVNLAFPHKNRYDYSVVWYNTKLRKGGMMSDGETIDDITEDFRFDVADTSQA